MMKRFASVQLLTQAAADAYMPQKPDGSDSLRGSQFH